MLSQLLVHYKLKHSCVYLQLLQALLHCCYSIFNYKRLLSLSLLQMTSEKITKINELQPNQKMLYCKFIVLDVGDAISTKDGHLITTCRVADETASINLSLWDGKGKAIKSGDILKLSNGYTNVWKRSLTLYTGKAGHLTRTGEFLYIFAEIPYLSTKGLFPEVGGRNFKQLYNNELERPSTRTMITEASHSFSKSISADHQITKLSFSNMDQNGHENRPDCQPHTIITPALQQSPLFNSNSNCQHAQNFYPNNIFPHMNFPHCPPKTAYSPLFNTNMKQNNGSIEIDKCSKKY